MAVLGPGDMLGDRYRLDVFVAAGGMGQVWRATDVVLSRTVAVKVLLPQLLTDPGFEARFRAEARIIAALRHAGVVNVYDYGENADDVGRRVLYLVMAYVEGESLSEKIERAGRLSVAETMSVVAQAADALQAAHDSGIVHRDVKPGNLLVQDDGHITLVDFGVARSNAVTSVTTGNAVPGTALYMAPEQASGQQVTGATDIYALGAVAYHCLAGYPPFNGTNPIEIALKHLQDEVPPLPDDVPIAAQQLVMRAMAKDPAARFESGAAMAAAARTVMRSAGPAGTTVIIPPAIEDGTTRTVAHVPAAAVAAPATGAYAASGTTAHDLRPVTPEPVTMPPGGGGSPRRRMAAIIGAAAAVLIIAGILILVFAVSPNDGVTPPADGSTNSNAPASNGPLHTTSRPRTATTRPPSTGPTQAPTSSGPTAGTTTAGPPPTTEGPPPTTAGPTDGPPTQGASQPANGASKPAG
jgi:predicted Ser/Thr protein kinase